jgi:hypothetical protein
VKDPALRSRRQWFSVVILSAAKDLALRYPATPGSFGLRPQQQKAHGQFAQRIKNVVADADADALQRLRYRAKMKNWRYADAHPNESACVNGRQHGMPRSSTAMKGT